MTDFVFRVDAFHLTPAQTQQISTAIQGAVLMELAKLDLQGKPASSVETKAAAGGGSALFFPHLWNGGWLIGQVANIANIANQKVVVQASATAGV